jgi:hypothetical protein
LLAFALVASFAAKAESQWSINVSISVHNASGRHYQVSPCSANVPGISDMKVIAKPITIPPGSTSNVTVEISGTASKDNFNTLLVPVGVQLTDSRNKTMKIIFMMNDGANEISFPYDSKKPTFPTTGAFFFSKDPKPELIIKKNYLFK